MENARLPSLNMLNSAIMVFFAILLVGFSGCSVMVSPEMGMPEPTGKKNTADTDTSIDGATTAKVKAAIHEEPLLAGEEIGVETRQGTVRLKGAVSSILVMEKAIEVARGVKGVREVKDEMQFRWQY